MLPHVWVEVLRSGRWESFDPESGYSRGLPYYFVPVCRGGVDIVRWGDATEPTIKYSIARKDFPEGTTDLASHRPMDILNLERLPDRLQDVTALLLLIPLGALVTAVARTIIGLRTFGTFTPTLLALSFINNNLLIGLIVFLAVLVLGFSSRSLLDRLKLLLVPRLGIILTLVVLCMVFSISVLDYLEHPPMAQAVLLPMVILTMLVERFYVTTEEDSLRFAVQLLVGTLVMAFVVYALLGWRTVGQHLVIYPELHLFTIVALILVGRYTGYRWTELWAFPRPPPAKGARKLSNVQTRRTPLGNADGTAAGWRAGHQPPQRRICPPQQPPPALSPRRRQGPDQRDLPAAANPGARNIRDHRASRRRAEVSRPHRPPAAIRHQAGLRQRRPRHHGHPKPRRQRVLFRRR